MTKLQINQLFLDFETKTYSQLSKEYKLAPSTLARWKYMGLIKVIDMKFHNCIICGREFYRKGKEKTCSKKCSKKLRKITKRNANEKWHNRLSDYDKYLDRKKRTIVQRIKRRIK